MLGRLDPKTGAMKEFPLPTPKSGPHGLTEDKAGNIWYTGNGAGLVGKLDPKTGAVTEYKMPDPAARDPHTPVFDPKGMLWFSVQQANMMGRLDPQTGEIKLVTMPTPRSLPYGVVMDSKGVPFVVLFGTNKVARLDPDTMAVREYPLPNAGQPAPPHRDHERRHDLVCGLFARLSGTARSQRAARSRSGRPQAVPSRSRTASRSPRTSSGTTNPAVRPNTLVRFDPKTEKFQSWIIPSGGIVVRNMMATKEGNLVLACSGVNRVALVEIK